MAVIDVPEPTPDAHEIVVRLEASLTCTHWDLTLWDGVDIFERLDHPKYPLEPGAPQVLPERDSDCTVKTDDFRPEPLSV